MPLQIPNQIKVALDHGIIRAKSGNAAYKFNKREKNHEGLIIKLKAELANVRAQSIEASRKGDFMRVARCTTIAQALNARILNLQIGINDNFVSY